MPKLSAAMQLRQVAVLSSSRSCQASVWSRSLSSSNRLAEDSRPRTRSPRAQAQFESSEAIQKLAQSRVAAQQNGNHPRPMYNSSTNSNMSGFRLVKLDPSAAIQEDSPSGFRLSRDSPSPRISYSREPYSNTRSSSLSDSGSYSRGPRRSFGPRTGGYSSPGGPSRFGGRGASDRGSRSSGPRTFQDRRGGSSRRRGPPSAEEEEEDVEPYEMTEEELDKVIKDLETPEPFKRTIAAGPYLNMAEMMREFAPKHIGVTEPATGQYPPLVDSKRRGLLHNIVMQARKNETYTEKDIDQLVKKLGPSMPRA